MVCNAKRPHNSARRVALSWPGLPRWGQRVSRTPPGELTPRLLLLRAGTAAHQLGNMLLLTSHFCSCFTPTSKARDLRSDGWSAQQDKVMQWRISDCSDPALNRWLLSSTGKTWLQSEGLYRKGCGKECRREGIPSPVCTAGASGRGNSLQGGGRQCLRLQELPAQSPPSLQQRGPSLDPSLGAIQAQGPREHHVSCLESFGVGANSGTLCSFQVCTTLCNRGNRCKPPGSVLLFQEAEMQRMYLRNILEPIFFFLISHTWEFHNAMVLGRSTLNVRIPFLFNIWITSLMNYLSW